jgi:Nucleotidyltransferase/DNA polymerase involved in DNA repair
MNDLNKSESKVMHIDLNSCFATCEQQARPMLRGRPVAISNRAGKNSAIITASYEAKAGGVKVGMRRLEAVAVLPELIFIEAEPSKYRYVYHKLLDIMQDYSAHVTMKSIDEGVIDFAQASEKVQSMGLQEVGREIKRRLRNEIGCYMRCNVGIATNRFLAKTAAGLNKPDGMDEITHENLRDVYGELKLTDLTGIASATEKRLNAVGIFTPLDFLDATEPGLTMAFKSVCGKQWYQRLRGYEVDDYGSDIKTVGRQYVLESNQLDFEQILQRLFHLAEEVGDKLRKKGKEARGVYVYAKTYDRGFWHRCQMMEFSFYSNQAIWNVAKQLFFGAPDRIKEIGVTCYGVCEPSERQLSIFGDELARERQVTGAIDEINTRFGPRTIHACETLQKSKIKTKIPFGSTRYL